MSVLDQAGFEAASGRRLGDRRMYADAIASALRQTEGFAAGKLGGSEQAWLTYPALLEREQGMRLRAYEAALAHRSLRHSGIWPVDQDSLRAFCDRFVVDVTSLDAIGLFSDAFASELEIVKRIQLAGMLMPFELQEPPLEEDAETSDCWLEHLRGRRVLIVCPFAEFLAERARPAIYEAAWSSVGKRWFEPATVDFLEIPYGFDPETQRRYGSALGLRDEIATAMDARDFDVALIGAGGLGIPLAAHAKRTGRIGLSLGGHLQIIFGVHGERWRRRSEWREVFNDAWVGLPDRYRPDPGLSGENYW